MGTRYQVTWGQYMDAVGMWLEMTLLLKKRPKELSQKRVKE